MSEQTMSNIRVVDLTRYAGGPYCTKMLADFGAEVLKIEQPGRGDPARAMPPFLGDQPHPDKSGLFLYINTGKKSITLNLKTPEGIKIIKDMVKEADVVVENFAPGVMAKLGLDYSVLREINPQIIMASISNFGQTGPYRDFKATDITLLALGGAMFIAGDPDRGPVKIPGPQAQYMAGITAFQSVMIALLNRQKTGVGRYIDISIMGCVTSNLESATAEYGYLGTIRRGGEFSRVMFGHPTGYYPCRNGHVVVIPGLGGINKLALLVEDPELENHPLFQDRHARQIHHEEFDTLILPWLMAHDKEEVEERAQELRMPFAGVMDQKELREDEQLESRGFFVEIDHPATGKISYPGAPFKSSESLWQAGRAPLLGEHNVEIFEGRLGYVAEDMKKLHQAGVI